ncbi:MAG: dihydroorotate dehydrogenase electron transfer subunit [Planctomycetes bacterium]|nr:dihydroorotate dehydrogenase electron transfer subunit [Planctomycetota bacterium]
MENPLAAACYADHARQHQVVVTENVQLATDTYRLRFECPELAAEIVPGQFLMLRLPASADPLLGRPFALYDTVLDDAGKPVGVDVVYLVVGKLTGLLAQCQPGDRLEVWGPLGNGFFAKPDESAAEPVEHLIMVAGGIGQTPFLALGRQFLGGRAYGQPQQKVSAAKSVTLCLGIRRQDLLAGAEDFRECGIDLRISSDDGSVGHHGLVTELLEQTLNEKSSAACHIASCGPEPMMEAVAKIAVARDVPCEVSLETPMACGIGICFSCVVKTKQPDGDWDYKRTCVDGPVFEAGKIVW